MISKHLAQTGGLAFVLIFALAAGAQAGLVAHWSMDDGPGSAIASDIAGSYDATLTNMDPSTDWVSDVPPVFTGGSALDFDGSNDYLAATGYKGVTGTDPRTVSAWIKVPPGATNHSIVSWGTNSAGKKWNFRVQDSNGDPGTIRLEVNGGFQVGTTDIRDNQWHHVAVTWDASGSDVRTARLWVDGELEGDGARQSTNIDTASNRDVYIGQDFSSREFVGRMDDARIYDNALTRADIATLAGKTVDPYWQAVQADAPQGYWRLGEASGAKAYNEGSISSTADGSYAGSPATAQPSLLAASPNSSVLFDGSNDVVNIPNNATLNGGGLQRSQEAWFATEAFPSGTNRRVIFEEGGTTHGANLYVEQDSGKYYFHAGAWENDTGHFPARIEVQPGSTYHAVGAYDSVAGVFMVYVNGAPVSAKVASLNPLDSPTGANGIGAMNDATRFDSGTDTNDGHYFQGTIDEVASYGSALTLRSVQTHYVTGSGDRLGLKPGTALGVALNYDASNAQPDGAFNDSIGTRPNNGNADQFNWDMGGIPRVAVDSPFWEGVTHAYHFDGSAYAMTNAFQKIAGDPSLASASFETLFRPSDLNGNEVIFETGGSTDGTVLWLQGSQLRFDVKDGGASARAQFDLSTLPADEIADFLHVVALADLANEQALLYVNGILRATASATGGSLLTWSGNNDAGLGGGAQLAFGSAPSQFEGDIALLRLYSGLLSEQDIAGNLQAAHAPEPVTLALLALAGTGLGGYIRRRK